MERVTDEELVERYRAERGSPDADARLSELFERHSAKVASWCLQITGDVNSAADLAQEVFLKVFQQLPYFRGSSKFTTWLYSITRNCCFDELRSRAVRPKETSEIVLDQIVDGNRENTSSALERRESEDLLHALIRESLDETEKKVLTLHYVHELPMDVVGRMLGLTNPSGAKAYIVSARRKLKRAHERWKTRNQLSAKGAKYVG